MTDAPQAQSWSPSEDHPEWWQPCMNEIKFLEGVPCKEEHCSERLVKKYTEAICNCEETHINGCRTKPRPECCPFTAASAILITGKEYECYCCCGCLARNTPVAFGARDYKAIEEFEVGDMLYVAEDASLATWSTQRVLWSAGAAGGHNTMIKVSYLRGDEVDFLLVSRDQPFLVADRTLKIAAKLVPGTDTLLNSSGEELKVVALQVGTFEQGLHHVATSTGPATSVDRHLLLAKDVVCGDWALQVAIQVGRTEGLDIAEDLQALPEIGTRAYEEAYGELEHGQAAAAVAGVDLGEDSVEDFVPFGTSPRLYIPENAQAFFTPEQAGELEERVSQAPPTSDTGRAAVDYLFTLFGAFYPDVQYVVDKEESLPNAYFFEQYERTFFVVTGGLMRTEGFGYAGLALVIAHAIGAEIGGEPKNEDGYSCVAVADYAAVSGVIPSVWLGLQSASIIKAGISQVEELFAAIETHRGTPGSCMDPPLDCRLETLQAAYNILPLPECAGGPPNPELELQGASGEVGSPHGKVTLTFSMPLDPASAEELGNYAFEPLIDTFEASVVESEPKTVVVSARLKKGIGYKVTALGVLSADGHPLLPGHASASFKAKGPSGAGGPVEPEGDPGAEEAEG